MPVIPDLNGRLYLDIAGLSCMVRDNDSFVTIYKGNPDDADAVPVATMQRRRVYDGPESPVWTVYSLDGVLVAKSRGPLWTMVGLLKATAKALAHAECAKVCEAARAVDINAHPHHGAGYDCAVIMGEECGDYLVSLDALRDMTAHEAANREAAKNAPVERREEPAAPAAPIPAHALASTYATAPAEDSVTVSATASGWEVRLYKVAGLAKGSTVIATVCGGELGKRVAQMVAQEVATSHFIEDVRWNY